MPCPELSDQLGAENLPRLVKITFLPEATFLLSSYHSPTFHEPILVNQPATKQAAGLIRKDYLCPMFTGFDLNPGPPTKSYLIYPRCDDITCQPGEGLRLLGIVAGITKLGVQVGEQVAKNTKLK
jgi:hypothetical protein